MAFSAFVRRQRGHQEAPPTEQVGACAVCVLVLGDETAQPVRYCGLCDAWICDEHRTAWGMRALAALRRR